MSSGKNQLQRASSQELSVVISRVGEWVSSALTKKGLFSPGEEMPPAVYAPMNEQALATSLFGKVGWERGELLYASASLSFDEWGETKQVQPPHVVATFESSIQGHTDSKNSRAMVLMPSFGRESAKVIVDDTELPSRISITEKDVERMKARSEEDTIRTERLLEAENIMAAIVGHDPRYFTRAEVREIGKIAAASFLPETIQIHELPPELM